MQADKPGSVPHVAVRILSFIWYWRCRQHQAAYPFRYPIPKEREEPSRFISEPIWPYNS